MTLWATENQMAKRFLMDFWREFLWVGLLSLMTNLLMLTPTLYMLQIYDRVMMSRSELTLLFLTMLVAGLFLMTALSEWLRSRLLVRAGLRMDEKLSPRVFEAAFESQLAGAQHDAHQAFTHLTNIRQFFTGAGVIALFDVPWTPIYIIVISLLHPLLGIIAIVFALIQLGMAFLTHQFTYSSSEAAARADAKSREVLHAKLRNAESVEAMGMLGSLHDRWLEAHSRSQAQAAVASNQQKQFQSLTKFLRYAMQSITLGSAAMLVIHGELSVGAMIAANVLMTRALQPLDQLAGSWRSAIQAKEAIEKLTALLKAFPENLKKLHNQSIKGELRFNELEAMASSRVEPILHGLNFMVPAGQVTAIIGPSGSGKSTLARCIVGVWSQTHGQVSLDHVALEEWDREYLGQHIGYLPQDIELLDGTIADNISRFDSLDSEKVIEAAKRCGIHEMILRLPMGYDTPIGTINGILSSGQRQRLALARALYGNPQVIVLDEPNANLDDQGEQALLSAIQTLKAEHKTIFLITHRNHMLAVSDFLLILESGRIAHYGPRDEVVNAIAKK